MDFVTIFDLWSSVALLQFIRKKPTQDPTSALENLSTEEPAAVGFKPLPPADNGGSSWRQ